MITVSSLAVKLICEHSAFDKGMRSSSRSMRGFGAQAANTQRRIVGFSAAIAGLAATAYGISRAVGGLASFEKQMAEVSTMLNVQSMKYMPEYTKAIKRMSIEFGQDTSDLARGLYDILSASVAPAKALDVLNVSVKAATAGLTGAGVAADAITTILNSYSMSADQAGYVSDVLFTIVKRGKTTFAELAPNIGKVAAQAAVAGLSFEELSAAIATLTRAGLQTEIATTAMKAVINAFIKSTPQAQKVAAKYGIELSSNTLRTIGLVGALEKLKAASAEELGLIMANIRGYAGFAAAIKQIEWQVYDLNLMLNSAGTTHEAYNKIIKSTSFRLDQIRQSFKILIIEIGSIFKPIINTVTKIMTSMSDRTRTLIGNTIKWIAIIWLANKAIKALVWAYNALIVSKMIASAILTGGVSILRDLAFAAGVAAAAMGLLHTVMGRVREESVGGLYLGVSKDKAGAANLVDIRKRIAEVREELTAAKKEVVGYWGTPRPIPWSAMLPPAALMKILDAKGPAKTKQAKLIKRLRTEFYELQQTLADLKHPLTEQMGLEQEAGSLHDSTRTALERHTAEIGKYDDMLKQELITEDTHNRGVAQSAENYQRATGELKDYRKALADLQSKLWELELPELVSERHRFAAETGATDEIIDQYEILFKSIKVAEGIRSIADKTKDINMQIQTAGLEPLQADLVKAQAVLKDIQGQIKIEIEKVDPANFKILQDMAGRSAIEVGGLEQALAAAAEKQKDIQGRISKEMRPKYIIALKMWAQRVTIEMKGLEQAIADAHKKQEDMQALIKRGTDTTFLESLQWRAEWATKEIKNLEQAITELQQKQKDIAATEDLKNSVDELRRIGQQITESVMTPLEKYELKITELGKLFDTFIPTGKLDEFGKEIKDRVIDFGTYGRAVRAARDDLENATKQAEKLSKVGEAKEFRPAFVSLAGMAVNEIEKARIKYENATMSGEGVQGELEKQTRLLGEIANEWPNKAVAGALPQEHWRTTQNVQRDTEAVQNIRRDVEGVSPVSDAMQNIRRDVEVVGPMEDIAQAVRRDVEKVAPVPDAVQKVRREAESVAPVADMIQRICREWEVIPPAEPVTQKIQRDIEKVAPVEIDTQKVELDAAALKLDPVEQDILTNYKGVLASVVPIQQDIKQKLVKPIPKIEPAEQQIRQKLWSRQVEPQMARRAGEQERSMHARMTSFMPRGTYSPDQRHKLFEDYRRAKGREFGEYQQAKRDRFGDYLGNKGLPSLQAQTREPFAETMTGTAEAISGVGSRWESRVITLLEKVVASNERQESNVVR